MSASEKALPKADAKDLTPKAQVKKMLDDLLSDDHQSTFSDNEGCKYSQSFQLFQLSHALPSEVSLVAPKTNSSW
jgi:hypothetical protein